MSSPFTITFQMIGLISPLGFNLGFFVFLIFINDGVCLVGFFLFCFCLLELFFYHQLVAAMHTHVMVVGMHNAVVVLKNSF